MLSVSLSGIFGRVTRKPDPRRLVVTPGFGGWAKVEWRAGEPGELVAFVRFEADERAVLRAVEVRVVEPWLPLLRDLPLGRIENAVNADAGTRFELIQHIGESLYGQEPATMFAMKDATHGTELPPRVYLERPAKRRLDDTFYANVAAAYVGAVAWGLDPRKTLALDSGTPADTVARWIGEARRRGYLSSGEPGKASGRLSDIPEGPDNG